MRKRDLDANGEAVDRAAVADGVARTGEVRRKRRRWGVEEKIRIMRESFASGESRQSCHS